jgi:lysophospholipid acyltransferase (LPLAT)-like uncharacterized protein
MQFQKKIKFFWIRKLTKFFIHSIIKSSQINISGKEKIIGLREKNIPIIYAYWHRHILFMIHHFKNSAARPLISLSQDGEIVSQIACEFGMNPVRGSSSKGGARAFLKLINTIKNEHSEILITADGPKGPLKQVKDGTIMLAQKSGAVIVPICWYSDKVKILEKSWDKFIIPLPFGKITFLYGNPFQIPEDFTKKDLPMLTSKLKEEIDKLEYLLENNLIKNQVIK